MSKKAREWRTIINNRACINGSVLAGTFVQACNFNSCRHHQRGCRHGKKRFVTCTIQSSSVLSNPFLIKIFKADNVYICNPAAEQPGHW